MPLWLHFIIITPDHFSFISINMRLNMPPVIAADAACHRFADAAERADYFMSSLFC